MGGEEEATGMYGRTTRGVVGDQGDKSTSRRTRKASR